MDHLLKVNTIRVVFGQVNHDSEDPNNRSMHALLVLTVFGRRAGLLISDRVIAPGSLRELNEYLDSHVTKLFNVSNNEFAVKLESKSPTLLDSLGIGKLDVKVIIFLRVN